MNDLWDDPSDLMSSDPDELKPTCKVIPFPKMSFDERLDYDSRSMETLLRYQGVPA